MSDSNGGVGGVGGVGGSSGSSSANAAAEAASAAGRGPTADQVADAMVDATRGPQGVDTSALGGLVAGLNATNPALGAQVQSAIEGQLSAVDAGRLQGAIAAASAALQPSVAQHVAAPPSLAPDVTQVNPSYSYNTQGQLVDACGNRVASVGNPDRQQAALDKSLADITQHVDRITGGPISRLAYNAAYLSGASPSTLDNVHALGKIADGFAKPLEDRAEQMHVPLN